MQSFAAKIDFTLPYLVCPLPLQELWMLPLTFDLETQGRMGVIGRMQITTSPECS